MDPFLVLLHSVSVGLSSSDLTQLKFLCRNRVSKRKLELAQSGLDLFTVLLEQNELSAERTVLLRELLGSLRREDLLRLLDDFERGAEAGAAPEERDLRVAMEIICDNVGKDWKRLARRLRVSEIKIEAIEEKYPRNLVEQVRELLRVWKNSAREDAAVSCLVSALRGCQLNVVADLIEEDQWAQAHQRRSASPGSLMAWDSGSAAPGAS
ncbi:FADD [Ovibos moschatus]